MGKGFFPAAVRGEQKLGQNFAVGLQEITAREIDLGIGDVIVGVTGKDVELNSLLLESDLFIKKVNDLGIDATGGERGDVIAYFFDLDLVKGQAIGVQHDLQLGNVVGVQTNRLSGKILDPVEVTAAKGHNP